MKLLLVLLLSLIFAAFSSAAPQDSSEESVERNDTVECGGDMTWTSTSSQRSEPCRKNDYRIQCGVIQLDESAFFLGFLMEYSHSPLREGNFADEKEDTHASVL
ncbi:hypothetical protein Y032_0558g3431 [Ancylostoma ceylanicum]|uniref:Uncharacterized protein n=1 Tax=Ancylostoma ceylanicum TaxID=53326 RepID=A0A016WQ12_9BILA|nr:hypothetical protein Y032_0558g3431 [Ancylostoma ceylanicum]